MKEGRERGERDREGDLVITERNSEASCARRAS